MGMFNDYVEKKEVGRWSKNVSFCQDQKNLRSVWLTPIDIYCQILDRIYSKLWNQVPSLTRLTWLIQVQFYPQIGISANFLL